MLKKLKPNLSFSKHGNKSNDAHALVLIIEAKSDGLRDSEVNLDHV